MLGWKSPLLYMQGMIHYYILNVAVAPREGRVSRNHMELLIINLFNVAPREGRVSRNSILLNLLHHLLVAPREGRVSRNIKSNPSIKAGNGRAPRGACE